MNEQLTFSILPGELADIPVALQFRDALFRETGVPASIYVAGKDEIILDFYRDQTRTGQMRHFFAYNAEGQPVAVAGALIKDDFPFFLFKPGYYGWIIDVYTLPAYRRKGLAGRLLEETLQWLQEKGVREVRLLSFEADARRIYERYGFTATQVMSLSFDDGATIDRLIGDH
jgi:GNAT superfamily N-acetyltransferase